MKHQTIFLQKFYIEDRDKEKEKEVERREGVADSWSCNTKAASTKLSSCSWHKQVAAYSVLPNRGRRSQQVDILEIGWTGATDTVKTADVTLNWIS